MRTIKLFLCNALMATYNYVTRTENGGESKYPERVITLLEPVA